MRTELPFNIFTDRSLINVQVLFSSFVGLAEAS